MKKKYDVLLISPWSEEIKVSPMFHIMRKEIEKCSEIIFRQKLPHFAEMQNDMGKNVLQYYERIPISTGLLSIAAVLKNSGYSVKYISLDYYKDRDNAHWLEDTLKQELDSVKYLVGVTSVTPEINRAIKILEMCKKIKPEVYTVIGGPHVSYLPEIYASKECVDFVSRGEGEYTILELTHAISENLSVDGIKGLTYKKGNTICNTADRELCDLKELPDPAYELLPANDRQRFKYHTYFSRGCCNKCDYCVEGIFFGPQKRFRRVDKFIDELEKFSEEYGWKYIHVFDSDFVQANPYIEQICDEIEKRQLDIILSINVSPRLHKMIDKSLLSKMVKSGFKEFLIGSETASESVINNLNRKQTFDDVLKTTEMLKDVEAPIVSTYLVVGLPGETRTTLLETIKAVDYLFKNNLIYHGSAKMFVPYPGTAVCNKLTDFGIEIVNHEWEYYDRYNFPPAYINKNISVFELYEFVNLFHAMQLSYFTKRTGREYECYQENLDNISKLFSNAIYL